MLPSARLETRRAPTAASMHGVDTPSSSAALTDQDPVPFCSAASMMLSRSVVSESRTRPANSMRNSRQPLFAFLKNADDQPGEVQSSRHEIVRLSNNLHIGVFDAIVTIFTKCPAPASPTHAIQAQIVPKGYRH